MARSLASSQGGGGNTPVLSPGVSANGVFSQTSSGLPSPALTGSRKRNIASAGLESSPGSDGEDGETNSDKKRHPVKRACNECRQQKLRCDVVQEPFTTCSRCRRLNLECKIESNFKRIGKRSRNAEMEREIIELRREIQRIRAQQLQQNQQHQRELQEKNTASSLPVHLQHDQQPLQPLQLPTTQPQPQQGGALQPIVNVRPDDYAYTNNSGSNDAVAGLLDLRTSGAMTVPRNPLQVNHKAIADVSLPPEVYNELVLNFFTYYHPFLPFLDPNKTPDEYYAISPLLFWTVVAVGSRRSKAHSDLVVRLNKPIMGKVWSTLAEVPQSYHIVKALCLLCTWPFPTSSTSTDPTFILCGMMMHVAKNMGLHRPSHAQDFSKFRVEFREGELKDRVRTWAVCNTVAQRVSTGYGQPSSALFDWTLSENASVDPNFRLPRGIKSRLDIEMFCAKVSESLYGNRGDPVGLSNDQQRYILIGILSQDLEALQKIVKEDGDAITSLYLHAANLHLRLSAFFDDPTATDYRRGLMSLYLAAVTLLEAALELKGTDPTTGETVDYTTNYLYQMTLAAGFVLLKLCKSPFAHLLDINSARNLFNRTIWGLRNMSVSPNDLPHRMTEVLALMWKSAGLSSSPAGPENGAPTSALISAPVQMDDSLKIQVKCRMSMSLVFDSVWRWREEFLSRGGHNVDLILKNPTNLDSTDATALNTTVNSTAATLANVTVAESARPTTPYPITTTADPSLGPPQNSSLAILAVSGPGPSVSTPTPMPTTWADPYDNQVFDPLNWVLDGQIDFPTYPFNQFLGNMDAPGSL